MKCASALLLVSFFAVGVFGFAGMHIGEQSHDGKCIAALAQGIECPKQNDISSSLSFHLGSYKSFSLATFGGGTLTMLLLLASLLLGEYALFRTHLFHFAPRHALYFSRLQRFPLREGRETIRWLALHENSPAIF